jgi:hypothetical protein
VRLGQNQNIRNCNEYFENVAKLKYLWTTLTNENDIRNEVKSIINSGNDCCYSVQNTLSSPLISKSLRIKVYETVIFPLVLYGCESWSVNLKEEHKLSVFEKSVERIFGPKREEDG